MDFEHIFLIPSYQVPHIRQLPDLGFFITQWSRCDMPQLATTLRLLRHSVDKPNSLNATTQEEQDCTLLDLMA